jgi:peptidoglycan hydrolase CwlO-like protein
MERMITDKSYKFIAAFLVVIVLIMVVFLFKSNTNGKFWKEESKRIEQEYKRLDQEIQRYHFKTDSLNKVIENRYVEIKAKDSIIKVIEFDISRIKRKYEKMYRSLDSLDAVGNYKLFTKYTDTIQ